MRHYEKYAEKNHKKRDTKYTADKDKPNLAFIEDIQLGNIGSVSNPNASVSITPSTTNGPSTPENYTFQLLNTDLASISPTDSGTLTLSNDNRTQTIRGSKSIELTIKDVSADTSRTIFQTVVFVTGESTAATRVIIIKNNSKGTFE